MRPVGGGRRELSPVVGGFEVMEGGAVATEMADLADYLGDMAFDLGLQHRGMFLLFVVVHVGPLRACLQLSEL